MAVSPQDFFEKNSKWIALVLFLFIIVTGISRCNRNMGSKIIEKQNKHTIDSLVKKYDILYNIGREKDAKIDKLQAQLEAEKDKSEAVLSVAKMNASKNINITNNIPGNRDTTKRK